ncbi:reverse transcriptase domain-containing protein [Tanacetum coccineum]|uniref:Reverse transcriptase domain-containing protein n=1 Tax=Tanacetum coccineum TaxID=301880 RepID=A0ABQ5D509_9ASTR
MWLLPHYHHPHYLYIPPPVDRKDDIPESERPPRKRSCLFALGSRYEVGESSTARPTGGRRVGYGIRDTWMDPEEAVPEIAPMTVGDVNTRVTELVELHEHDTKETDKQKGRMMIIQNNHGLSTTTLQGDQNVPSGSGNANMLRLEGQSRRAVPKGNYCFECGAPGHFKRDCPKLKNRDGGNGNAQGWVYTVGNCQ